MSVLLFKWSVHAARHVANMYPCVTAQLLTNGCSRLAAHFKSPRFLFWGGDTSPLMFPPKWNTTDLPSPNSSYIQTSPQGELNRADRESFTLHMPKCAAIWGTIFNHSILSSAGSRLTAVLGRALDQDTASSVS